MRPKAAIFTHQNCKAGLTAIGNDVVLIPAQYVDPSIKSLKNYAVDPEAIWEAAQRPGMRFAVVRSEDHQAMQSLHRCKRLLIKQRTQMINTVYGQCLELGIISPQTG